MDLKEKNKIIKNCLSNAEALIASAEELKNRKGRKNIAYTLAALGLEEVGKASMLKSIFGVEESGVEPAREMNLGMDDHVKKLFWAFWGASFGKEKITQELINQYKGLATVIHNKRLEYLYTDTENTRKPTITTRELNNIVSLAWSRLMMEKSYGLLHKPDEEKAKRIKWFLEASQDIEKRKLIFGGTSIKKLQELKDNTLWVKWLYEEFQKADEESKKLIQQELNRPKPEGKEIAKDKWEVEIRLDSQSHSLKNKALNNWNKHINNPKLFLANKNELIVKFTLPAGVHATQIWESSLDLLNQFLIALNVGAVGGIIFRNIPKDSAKFHTKVIDLENKQEIVVELSPKLSINWKDAHWVLDDKVLIRVQKVLLLLWTQGRKDLKLNQHLMKYLQGIIFFSKTDMHLHLEYNAFEMFMNCLIGFILEDNPNITEENLKAEIPKVFKLDSYKNLNKYLDVRAEMKAQGKTNTVLTLTDVIGAKMFCDFYILAKANENDKRLLSEK